MVFPRTLATRLNTMRPPRMMLFSLILLNDIFVAVRELK
jgi:hypothetical protein